MEAARRKLRIARYAIAVSAAAGLAGFAAAARVSHPATHEQSASSAASSSSQQQSPSTDDGLSGGFSSIGPSGSAAPQVQSGGS